MAKVFHTFHAGTDPVKVITFFEQFLWDYIEESTSRDPSEYDCWLRNDIRLVIKIIKKK